MNDVQRYSETTGAKLRNVLGIADRDISVRAREILDQAELEHRSRYGTAPPPRQWPWEAGLAAAAAEQFQVTPVTSYELAERWNAQDPLSRIGISPERPSSGFAMRTTMSDGQVVYSGDPAAVEAMKESFAADARRQVEASHRERVALGPLANTVK